MQIQYNSQVSYKRHKRWFQISDGFLRAKSSRETFEETMTKALSTQICKNWRNFQCVVRSKIRAKNHLWENPHQNSDQILIHSPAWFSWDRGQSFLWRDQVKKLFVYIFKFTAKWKGMSSVTKQPISVKKRGMTMDVIGRLLTCWIRSAPAWIECSTCPIGIRNKRGTGMHSLFEPFLILLRRKRERSVHAII